MKKILEYQLAARWNRIFVSMLIVQILCVSAIACSKEPQPYLSKHGDYTLNLPPGWNFLDDDRKLNEIRENINAKISLNLDMAPDVVFIKDKETGGMVVAGTLPIAKSDEDEPEDEEELFSRVAKSMSIVAHGLTPDRKSTTENINGKKFQISYTTIPGGKTIGALCVHQRKVYQFQFSASNNFEKWEPQFLAALRSIAFNPEALAKAKGDFEKNRAGFFMGVLHGIISPFRLVASFLWDVEVYRKHNEFGWYLAGFIFGILVLVGGGAKSQS